MELYALVQTLKHWYPYLVRREFILFTNHDSLKYLNSQNRLNTKHARWFDYLQQYDFTIKHKVDKENKVTDVLSRQLYLLTIYSVNVTRSEALKGLYATNSKFQKPSMLQQQNPTAAITRFALHDSFLTKKTQICIPTGSMREFVIQELHGDGIAGHFGFD